MHRFRTFFFLTFIFTSFLLGAQPNGISPEITLKGKGKVNTMIDNVGYWQRMVRLGYVKANRVVPVPAPVFTGSLIRVNGIQVQDSPDRCVTMGENTTQSENSLFINPENEEELLNSNNSTDWDGTTVNVLFGANDRYSEDAGVSWAGEIEGAGNVNQGDPSVVIGMNGWWYAGKINNDFGQSVAYSTDHGQNWHDVIVSAVPVPGSDILDKNHLWIDNSATSPFQGRLYDAWTNFVNGSPNLHLIELSRSEDHGVSWSPPVNINLGVVPGYMCQGINLQTGPAGELYGVFAIYDAWPADESGIGFTKSLNGGSVFMPATRIFHNIKGIRTSGTSKNLRVNSYPSMAVDVSSGPYKGMIYVVWTNIGVPGVNTGTDIDIYFMRSGDQGSTWTAPIKVNQDPSGLGKQHFFPWITCDPVTGNLCVIYYDDRNVSSSQCETWISYSYNAGDTWTDMKVSDVAFTPIPIPGLAYSYFGDYLGITSRNMMAYPIWTDNRDGIALTYVSPVNLGPAPNQPYILYDSYSLASIQKITRQNMNYGDSLYLTLGLKNIGDQPVTGVTAYLSTDSPYIIITDSTEQYGSFSAGEVKTVQNGYSFKVSDTIPDGLRVKFNVKAAAADTAWYSNFRIEAHAPGLKISRIVILDSVSGNNNGRLDPGESIDLQVTVLNSGDFNCPGTWIKVSSLSDYLIFTIDSVFIDTLLSRRNKTVVFKLDVAADACLHSAADLNFIAGSGLYRTGKNLPETIGVTMEDWETGDFTRFPWVSGGNSEWSITTMPYEGVFSARSGQIIDNQSSWLQVDYISGADDSISFYRSVSSESGYDYLRFYIDGIQQGQWSGEEPWERVSYPVSSGIHTFKWIYSTDIYQLNGSNAAWLDNITFPSPPLPHVDSGSDTTICAGQVLHLDAAVSAYDSLRWMTFGDGIFSNDTVPDPVYTPGTADINAGSVKLRLTAFGTNGCSAAGILLTIAGAPVVHITVFPNDTLCGDQTAHLSADPVPGGSYLWTPGGFTTPGILVDTSTTGGLGTRWFRLRVTSPNNCSSSDSVKVIFRDCTGISKKEAEMECEVFPNPNHGSFILKINSTIPGHLDIRLQNPLGWVVMEEKDISLTGSFEKMFVLEQLPPGIYLLSLQNGKERKNLKVIVR